MSRPAPAARSSSYGAMSAGMSTACSACSATQFERFIESEHIATEGEDFFIAATLADAERFHARTKRGVRQELFAHSVLGHMQLAAEAVSNIVGGIASRIARRGPDGRIRECRSAPTTAYATRTANPARWRCRQRGGAPS